MSIRRQVRAACVASVLALVGGWLAAPEALAAEVAASDRESAPERYVAYVLQDMDEYGYYATGEQWRAARAKAVRQASTARTVRATYPIIRAALKASGGPHSKLWTRQQFATAERAVRFPSVETTEGITTIALPEFVNTRGAAQMKYADPTAAAIAKADAVASNCGFILDLRDNLGGFSYPMFAAISPLIPDGDFMSIRQRDGSIAPYSLSEGRVMVAGSTVFITDDHPKVRDPIAVLYGDTASAGEAAAISLVGLDNTRSFGVTTYGLASINHPVTLADGARAMITMAMNVDRTGLVYDENTHPALVPDQPTTMSQADEVAAAWIRGQCAVADTLGPAPRWWLSVRLFQGFAHVLSTVLSHP